MGEKIKCRICGYEYTTPPNFCPKCLTPAPEVGSVKLPVEDMPPEEKGFIAGLIEGEGSFSISLIRVDMIKAKTLPPEEREYHRNYLLPSFTLEMREKAPVKRASKALGIPFHYEKKRKRWAMTISEIPHILAIAKWSLLYLTPESKRAIDANMVLNAFQKGIGIKITPEEVKEVWGLTTEERYQWLKEKKKI